jgi:cation-transporting ATPase E
MRLAVPWGVVVAGCCFVSYLVAYDGVLDDRADTTQASTAALITLITIALRVLAIVARPLAVWKVVLIGVMTALSAVMFVLPFTQEVFLLDPSNARYTVVALVCGGVGIVLVELVWWVDGRWHGEPRRLFAPAASRARRGPGPR